jgi:putative hydrolase of the HAD superfamily
LRAQGIGVIESAVCPRRPQAESRCGSAEACNDGPGAKEALTALQKMGLKLGIVSNTFVNGSSLEKHLEQFGLLDFFAVKLYSYEFDFRKPDTRIFEIAAERTGEMLENILFVGDRIDKDIELAIRSGMRAVFKTAYTNLGKKTPESVWKISDLSELAPLIEKINTQPPH